MKSDISFESLANEIIKNKKYKNLVYEEHHSVSRLDHSMHVAKYVYKISRKLNMDYVSATRAALLHDFFFQSELMEHNWLTRFVVHPEIALANASNEFKLNKIEKDAIRTHMFPTNIRLPKYKESWVVTLTDKIVSEIEMIEYGYKDRAKQLYNFLNRKIQYLSICAFYILTMSHK